MSKDSYFQKKQAGNKDHLLSLMAENAWNGVFSYLNDKDHRQAKNSCHFFKHISEKSHHPITYNNYKSKVDDYYKDTDIIRFRHDKGGDSIRTLKTLKNGNIISGTYGDDFKQSQLCVWNPSNKTNVKDCCIRTIKLDKVQMGATQMYRCLTKLNMPGNKVFVTNGISGWGRTYK